MNRTLTRLVLSCIVHVIRLCTDLVQVRLRIVSLYVVTKSAVITVYIVTVFLLCTGEVATSESSSNLGWIVSWSMPDSITDYGLDKYQFIIDYWTDYDAESDTVLATDVMDSTAQGRIYFEYGPVATDSIRYSFTVRTYIPSNPVGQQVSEARDTLSGLLLNWSMGAEVTLMKMRGDSVDVLAVYLPYGPWNLQWFTIRPDTVEAWFEYDFVMDGHIDISDFSYFGQGYGSIYDLSDLSIFGAMYEKQALLRYEARRAE